MKASGIIIKSMFREWKRKIKMDITENYFKENLKINNNIQNNKIINTHLSITKNIMYSSKYFKKTVPIKMLIIIGIKNEID